jgi:hypothetical protein
MTADPYVAPPEDGSWRWGAEAGAWNWVPASQAAGQPAPDPASAPAAARQWTQADLDYWTAPGRDRNGAVVSKAVADGFLADLGVGKSKSRGRRR